MNFLKPAKLKIIIITMSVLVLLAIAPWMNNKSIQNDILQKYGRQDGSIDKNGNLFCDYEAMWLPFGRWVVSCEGGYFVPFFYIKKGSNDNAQKQQIHENNKVAIENADWKTYRNEEYGFEFKYPKEYFISLPSYLTVNEATGGFDPDPQEELLNKDLIIDNTKGVTVWVNRIDSLPVESTREKDDPLQDTTQKDLITQRAEIESSKTFNGDYVAENKNSITKIIKIGDKKLKRSIWYSHQSSSFINTLEFFSKEGDLITIESYLLKAKNIEEAKNDPHTNIFDAIISAFKFTD